MKSRPKQRAICRPRSTKRRPPRKDGKSTSGRFLANEWNWQRKTRSGRLGAEATAGQEFQLAAGSCFVYATSQLVSATLHELLLGTAQASNAVQAHKARWTALQTSSGYNLLVLPHAMPARAHRATAAVRTLKLGEFVPQFQLQTVCPRQSRGLRMSWTGEGGM